MSIWICLLIPLIGVFVLLRWYKHTLTWWEVAIPSIACFLFILIFKFSVEKIQVDDTEYHGATVVEARYYEYWETWVKRTCYRSVKCGKSTISVPYDCSYCDHNPARWTVVNSLGEEFSVSEKYYNYLMGLWKATPRFVELNRNINYHYGCGKDGDMYKILWDKNPLTAKSTTATHSYENRVQAAHSAFDFVKVTEEDIKNYKLYEYPEVDGWHQETVLGLDSLPSIPKNKITLFKQMSAYLNGELGPKKHARIYFLFFTSESQMSASMQEAHWDGGNDNEVVICIGIDPATQKLKWVKPFSWTPNRRVLPDIREEIMNIGTLDPMRICRAVEGVVIKEYKRKDFKEFSYLTVEPPEWAIWTTAIITALITFFISRWATMNEAEGGNTSFSAFFEKRYKRWY
jgi:hypothetical protein